MVDLRQAFAIALKRARKAKGLTQDDFGGVSSRTYLSTLERGGNSPTLEKVHDLAEVMGVHPLTIFAMTYVQLEGSAAEVLLGRVAKELVSVAEAGRK